MCVQGLGFAGAAMAAAVACARGADGGPAFNVVGVELPSERGRAAVDALNEGRFPHASLDPLLDQVVLQARRDGNLLCTTDNDAYLHARVVCVDVQMDVDVSSGRPVVDDSVLRAAVTALGARIGQDCLVMVASTVPPGTCERVVLPELQRGFRARALNADAVLLAHSYERVMPGEHYLDSIIHHWRVYAGHDDAAATACRDFLSRVINVDQYPLTRLSSMAACETAKVLENSYRATNIAFMDEWARFAELAGLDLAEIVAAVRMRPSHSNMCFPGAGVGGYCLTKDPLLMGIAAQEHWGVAMEFPLSTQAVAINGKTPLATVALLERVLGPLARKRVLVCGVSYRPGVADTRSSPAFLLVAEMERKGAQVLLSDPLVGHWQEMGRDVPARLPASSQVDAVVFAVEHGDYRALDVTTWLEGRTVAVVDAANVLNASQRAAFREAGCRVAAVGRGELP